MVLRATAAFAALLLLGQATAPAAEKEFRGKRIPLAAPPRSQLAAGHPVHSLGREIVIGDATFAVAGDPGKPCVAPTPGDTPSLEIAPGKPVRLSWTGGGAKRSVLLSFARDGSGAWTWWASEAVQFRIEGEDLRLYDADGDGLHGDLAKDGWSALDTDQVLPLSKEIPLGPNLVAIRSIDPDGGRIVAEVAPLPGTGPQVAAQVVLNRLRVSNGLPPARLDERLSAGCTAHANYLVANGWNGRSNPHSQNLGPNGASPEGAAAAVRSGIDFRPPDVSILACWRTFYHRVGLMGPALDQIGVNAAPLHVAVVDIARGYGEGVTVPGVGVIRELTGEDWPWTDPVFVPADGSAGLPVAASPELPKGPVPDLGSRGTPLMALFRGTSRVTGFRGALEEVRKEGPVAVPVLQADPGNYPFARGIVPAAPLRPKSSYCATFTWHSIDEDADFRRTIRFRTE